MKTRLLAGALMLSIVFGSLHAFSVLILPLQHALGGTRAQMSWAYALAIVALTVAVYAAPYLRRRQTPAAMAATATVLAATGLMLAGFGHRLWPLLAGYGLLFGFANGMAYSLFLDRAAVALPGRKGFAIGLVTATYGGGAALFAPLLSMIVAAATVSAALLMLAGAILAFGLAASLLFAGSPFASTQTDVAARPSPRWLAVMWAVYFCGVLGGLMLIGHAAPLVEGQAGGTALAAAAVMLVAAGNIGGSIGGGLWAQHSSARAALLLPIAIAIIALTTMMATTHATLTLTALTLIGLAYGGLIAVIPVIVLTSAGADGFGYAFGRIFSAWGLAGLMGPPLAGWMFDLSESYANALMLAVVLALIALITTIFLLPRQSAGTNCLEKGTLD